MTDGRVTRAQASCQVLEHPARGDGLVTEASWALPFPMPISLGLAGPSPTTRNLEDPNPLVSETDGKAGRDYPIHLRTV